MSTALICHIKMHYKSAISWKSMAMLYFPMQMHQKTRFVLLIFQEILHLKFLILLNTFKHNDPHQIYSDIDANVGSMSSLTSDPLSSVEGKGVV